MWVSKDKNVTVEDPNDKKDNFVARGLSVLARAISILLRKLCGGRKETSSCCQPALRVERVVNMKQISILDYLSKK